MSRLNRRAFLRLSALGASSLVISTQLSGCAALDGRSSLSDVRFEHGVASGDPLADGVLLWTRATPLNNQAAVSLGWELARDVDFTQVVRSGTVQTSAARDYTVKIDVRELAPNTRYFYRFMSADGQSPVGKTKTLPIGDVKQLNLAIFSCANYPAGYFNVYHLAAQDDSLDAVLHLGDYLYEYGAGGYATERAEEIGRALPADNTGELLTLADYRKRYALYRTDKGLQALHAAVPFIAVWDDHEVTNDTWAEGAQNHNEGEGDFYQRRAAAVQAYYEWLPIRPPLGETDLRIYRRFDFGNLLSLHMLDTRIIARDKQLDYAEYRDSETGAFDQARFVNDISNPERTLLGKDQLEWLQAQLQDSSATWQLLGQQILMGKMHFPAELLANPDRANAGQRISELVALKQKQLQGGELSAEQQARVETVSPYNLDAWDGYPVEREILYRTAKALGKKLLVVAGDTHNAWMSQLVDAQGNNRGVEFATASVSSPGFERYLNLDESGAAQMAKALPLLIRDLEYCDLHQRGYLTLRISADNVDAHWQFVDNILSPDYQIASSFRYRHQR